MIVNNLFIINGKHLVFKINNRIIPELHEPAISILRIPDFQVDLKKSYKLIVVILQSSVTNSITALVISGIKEKSRHDSFINYTILSSNNIETNYLDMKYYIIDIQVLDIPRHYLYNIPESKYEQLSELKERYSGVKTSSLGGSSIGQSSIYIDEDFFKQILENIPECYSCEEKETNIIRLTNKEFYHRTLKSYNPDNYKNVKLYAIVNNKYKEHYSTEDVEKYNTVLKKMNTNLEFISYDKRKIPDLIQQIKVDRQNNITCFVVIAADPFNNICGLGANAPNILINNLIILYTLCTVIPDIDMVMTIGSKKYVADPDFNSLMLPNTYTYPPIGNFNYNEQIKNLPLGNYIMKQGYSGSGKDYYEWLKDYEGKYRFLHSDTSYKPIEQKNKVTGMEMFADIEDMYLNREKNIAERTENRKKWFDSDESQAQCDTVFIIQNYTELYRNCEEMKFIVIEKDVQTDKKDDYPWDIICVNTKTIHRIDKLKIYEKDDGELPPINPHIINFINKVVGLVRYKWRNYTYLRVDIICECDPMREYDVLFSQDKINIFLNEIEYLGSGLKSNCNPIHDKQINLYLYETNEFEYTYERIIDRFMNIINKKLNIK